MSQTVVVAVGGGAGEQVEVGEEALAALLSPDFFYKVETSPQVKIDALQTCYKGCCKSKKDHINQKNDRVASFTSLTVCSLSLSLSLFLFVCALQRGSLTQIPVVKETRVESGQFLLLSVLCMLFILVALAVSATFFCVRQRSHLRMKEKLASLGTDTSPDATATYQVRPASLL